MDHRLIPGPSFDWQPSKQCSVAFGLTAKRGVLQSSTADWQTALFWWPKMIWYYRPFPEDNGSDKSDRKVWVVLPPRPWQGDPLRVPVASPPPWLLLGIEPIQSQQIVSPIKHSRETSLSLHPSTWRAFLPPRPQTTSWRPTLRGLDAVILSMMNSIQGLSHPWKPTRRAWRRASLRAPNPCTTAAHLINNQCSVLVAPNTPKPFHGD